MAGPEGPIRDVVTLDDARASDNFLVERLVMTDMLPGLLADDTLVVAVEYVGATARHAVSGIDDVNMPLVERVRVTRRPQPTQLEPPSEWRGAQIDGVA